jgi:hypothetical protein
MRGGWRVGRRRRALVILLVTALLGVAQAPAGASPASRADDVPQPPDEIVPYVPELIDFGLLRDTLREQYKATFAGLVNNGNNAITIYETRANNAMHEWVTQRFEQAARDNDVDPALIPTVTYRTTGAGGLTLNLLFGLKDTIMAALGTLRPLGVSVESIGVQDGNNRLIVGVSTSIPLAQSVLEMLFGKGHILVIEWKLTNEADRYNDSAPWNGGDQLVSEGTNFTACTTGFGMHEDDGDHFVTSAGHCNTHFWWNTWAGFPIRDSSTLLGVTSGSVWNGVYFGYRVDTQKIITNGSSNVVWTNSATRRYISAPLDVAQGDPTCIEGSFSLTECGTIYATDFGEGGTQYLVSLSNGSTVFGDSGAPSWRTSPFGPLAQGTHVGSLSNGLRVELNVYAVMFFNGLKLNTPFDP